MSVAETELCGGSLSNAESTTFKREAMEIEFRPARTHQLLGFRLCATGSFIPRSVIRNQDLADIGYDDEWIVRRSGIRERHHADQEQACSDLAYEAARMCLARADVLPSEVDGIIVATITPDHFTPSTSCILQSRLGCSGLAMDINAACSGFVYALVTGAHFISSGLASKLLVLGSEIMSRTVNPTDLRTYPLFGDGAGAVLLSADDSVGSGARGFVAYTLGADGAGSDLIKIPAGGSRAPLSIDSFKDGSRFFRMEGRTVFKWGVRTIVESIKQVLDFAGLQIADIKGIVLHQANRRMMTAAAELIGAKEDQLIVQVDRVGNTSSASIPLALHEAVEQERFQEGDLVLLCGFGAGLTWGTAILRW